MFKPEEYCLDFVKEKIKPFLMYLFSSLELESIFRNGVFRWFYITIEFCDIIDPIDSIINEESIVSIHHEYLNNVKKNFTLLNQGFDEEKESLVVQYP